MTYCELHCHTHYSLLDGASSPLALVERAGILGMPALAITDHDGLYGVIPFWQAARERSVHPVIGAEITLAHGSHLTLLAETQEGYANLCRLITIGQLAGSKGAPRLTIEDVAGYSKGLLCLSGCRQGAVATALLADDEARARRGAARLLDIFGRERLWIELQHHRLLDDDRLLAALLALAAEFNLRVVATNDVHYSVPGEQRLHDVLTATRHNLPLAELGALARPNSEYYLKSQAEMATLFAELPQALAATQEIAERCRVSLDFSARRTPAFAAQSDDFPHGLPPGETAFSYLYTLCQAGLSERYKPVSSQAVRQLAHELSVIERAKLCDYFLIVWDIVGYARTSGIRCQGRGSAANSLVAYVLGITPVDPLRYDLLFERFLSEQSDTTPDVDLDFAADRRDEVMAYVYRRYGAEHTALVCNVATYQWRSAVRDAARSLGYAPEAVDRLARAFHDGPPAALPDDLQLRAAGTDVELVAELAGQLIDTPRHLSVHVGGMVVTALPLVEVVPLEHATKPGIVVAQWNKEAVEDAGLIKIDLLALRTLGMISEALALIEAGHGERLDLDVLPLDDPSVYRLLAEGDTLGCFQVESRAQTQMLPRLKPTCFEDIIVQVSVVRPGPIQGGMVHPYLRRRAGLEPVSYLHPSLEPVLRETLGVVIFQEQVLRVAMVLAGFTASEADRLRRAMSRRRSAQAMAEVKDRFLTGAAARGVEAATAEEAFRQLESFATYGFCKSHAASFALVAYQTLWLKAHYTLEFFCSLLNQQPMGFYSPEVVAGDARRHGLTLLRPDVNASEERCTLPGNSAYRQIRLGLRYLAGLGEAGSTRLLAARQAGSFRDLADFCRRTRLPRPLTGDLIRASALDSFGVARRQLLWALGGLRYDEEELIEVPEAPVELPELEERERFAWDYELLGLSPEGHFMALWRERLRARGVLSAAELAAQPAGRVVWTAGMVAVRQAPPTAHGHLFVTLEDETGLINLIIRPDLYAAKRAVLHNTTLLMAQGMVQREGTAVSLLVRRVAQLRTGS